MIELDSLAGEFGRMSAMQLVLVVEGVRPACRLTVRRERLAALSRFGKRAGVEIAVGFDAIKSTPVPGRGGYSEWCRRSPPSPEESERVHVFVSRTRAVAQHLRRADEADDERAVGRFLGYPACCTDWFVSTLRKSGNTADPVLTSYGSNCQIDWRLNVSLLCYDYGVLSHIPCSPGCEASLQTAVLFFDALRQRAPAFAGRIRTALCVWVLHSASWGVVAFSGAHAGVDVYVHNVVLADDQSVLAKLAQKYRRASLDGDGVVIGPCSFASRDVRCFEYIDSSFS